MATHHTPEHPGLSRRDFLKMAATGAGGLVAAGGVGALIRRAIEAGAPPAGGPDRLPGATATAPATATKPATATPEPTATIEPSPTPEFPVLLNAEVTPYATALSLEAPEVTGRVTQSEYHDLAGDRFTVALDPVTSIPLLVTNKEGKWQRASLKELAGRGGINAGLLLDWMLLEDGAQSRSLGTLLQNEFNFGLVGSGWGWSIQPDSRDAFNFDFEERLISVARARGIENFRLMHLISPGANIPTWLREGNFSQNELTAILTGYITRVMTHFKGVIGEYVVVNEASMPEDLFNQIIGPTYVDIAFQAAREADPAAKLVFNIWGNHWSRGPNTPLTREIVERLTRKGLIDKVGLQMHVDNTSMSVLPTDVERTIRSYGIPAAVTEFDVDLRDQRGTTRERFTQQAQVYENMIGAALRAGSKDIGFWGAPDNLSWLEQPEFNGSPDADPTMWDGDGNPKPAYYAVRKVLLAALRT